MEFSSNKFDQFGNYIGGSESESESSSEEDNQQLLRDPNDNPVRSILPEDKEYYREPSDVYPTYTKVKHEHEDRIDYTTPIIEPKIRRIIAADLKRPPETSYNISFMKSLFEHPESIRNVVLVGALGHGKTSLVDCLVNETHPNIIEKVVTRRDVTNQIIGEGRRLDRLSWTDRLFLEKRREMSISTEVMSLVHETIDGKPIALNIIDTPGHPDFLDQVEVGISMADGVVFCVDVVEGLTKVASRLLARAISSRLPMIICLTKIDRLILELKNPPEFAHIKITRVLEEINTALNQNMIRKRMSPELHNVVFTAAQFSLCFTLESISLMYNRNPKENYKFDKNFEMNIPTHRPEVKEFSSRLWGQYRIDGNQIVSSTSDELPHPFVKFVLEPIYKVFTHVLSYEPVVWAKKLRIDLTSAEQRLNTAPLLRIALSRIFGTFSSLVQMVNHKLPFPMDKSSVLSKGTVAALAAKFIPSGDGEKIYSLVRVFKGELSEGMKIYALSKSSVEDHSLDPTVTLGPISLHHVRYSTPIAKALPGMIVRIEFTQPELTGISTLTDILEYSIPPVILPIPLMKVAIEPLIPEKHPDMVKSIAKAQLCYPSLNVKVEVTGEHTLIGTGEMFLDCVMHDIRNTFALMEIKVSDPFAVFNETVGRQSATICQAEIDENNSIGIICEPLNKQTLDELEIGKLARSANLPVSLSKLGWDEMSCENLWSFGPNPAIGPNVLVDDTLPPKPVFPAMVRNTLERSFIWATSEGPLCDEMMRGVSIKIVDTKFDEGRPLMPVKIIPAVRKAIFASFLCAQPRLMEPIYFVEVIVPHNGVSFVEQIIAKRRGRVTNKRALHGTTLRVMTAEVPLIDSFGMEVDMRTKTQGQAFAQSFFYKWEMVPGDPLDNSIILRPLEPSPTEALAREFVVKSRRRRGQSEDVDLSKYVNDEKLIEIAQLLGSE